LLGGIAWLCAPWLVSFFIPNDPAVIAGGAHFIRIMCLAWGGMGIQLCIVSAFRASGNMLSAMIIAMVSQWMIQFPMAYILAKHTRLGPDGLWWSFPITNVTVALVSVAWFARGNWKTVRLTENDVEVAEVTREALRRSSGRPHNRHAWINVYLSRDPIFRSTPWTSFQAPASPLNPESAAAALAYAACESGSRISWRCLAPVRHLTKFLLTIPVWNPRTSLRP
jgi:hypothetical protein